MAIKRWNYGRDIDDHNYNSKPEGYVYWYGKYVPKETMDYLFPKDNQESSKVDNSGSGFIALLALDGVAAIYGLKKLYNYEISKIKKRL